MSSDCKKLMWLTNFPQRKCCHSGEIGEFRESCVTMLGMGYDGIAVAALCFSFLSRESIWISSSGCNGSSSIDV